MTILEMALIAAGLSMDIFAWTACRSTLFSNVGRKKLFSFIGAFGIWELISISLGFYVAKLLRMTKLLDHSEGFIKLIAVVIFFALAVRMLLLAMGKELIDERRQDEVQFLPLMKDTSVIAARTFLVGLAVSLCNTGVIQQYALLLLLGVLMAVAGLYAGYTYGFQIKSKAYFAGFLCLLITDVEFIVRFLVS